ncbi:MAG TPA: GNAT family N-acetyltransferase [Povalibacter sp.]|nr:GNAT family N-acetyltransferase [Povalibacter sp.]
MTPRFLTSIDRVAAAEWNALNPAGVPFLRHEFLAALESTGCVGEASGWTPHHLLLRDDSGRLLGGLPLYLKSHSWGEFVFDWSWARAYNQAGLDYYPKLVSMTPFTPASVPHLLVAPGTDAALVRRQLVEALLAYAQQHSLSSAHVLFIVDDDRDALTGGGFCWRKDCQFHWHNRGYASFDEFIAGFRAEKRKKALRERRRVREGGVVFRTLAGSEMTPGLWEIVFGFSARTFAQHGHEHYLNAAFFRTLCATLPDSIMVKLALLQDTPIAAAIFFRSADTLYGRYWGAAANFDSLHFETCYYQGIEYCIEQGLQRFEPGTQGEHKVARGFEPATTWSAHWIADGRFRRAISEYLSQERAAVDQYAASVAEHVPFRSESHRDPGNL